MLIVIFIVSNSCYFHHFHLDTFDLSLEVADSDQEDDSFWNLFIQFTTKLKSLNLLHFFTDHAITEVAHRKVIITECNTFLIFGHCPPLSAGESLYTGKVFSRV